VLCRKFEVGIKRNSIFDKAFLRTEIEKVKLPKKNLEYPRDVSSILTNTLKETFQKVGRTAVYKSPFKTIVARWSQRYKINGGAYWFSLTTKDIEAIDTRKLTHLAYVCYKDGVVLLPVKLVLECIRKESFRRSPSKGPLSHYFIQFNEEDGKLNLHLRKGVRLNVEESYYRNVE